MGKEASPSLFVNDGSFMERFKQLQQEEKKDKSSSIEESKPPKVVTGPSTTKPAVATVRPAIRISQPHSGGKLAFSLKQKSKIVAPAVKLAADEDEDEKDSAKGSEDTPSKRQKLTDLDVSEKKLKQVDVAPSSPQDPTVKMVADRLASFVAKHGRQIEHTTRQKNPGDTPFKFLFDERCADYKYYEYRLAEEERALSQDKESQIPHGGPTSISASVSKSSTNSLRSAQPQLNYQTPSSALYENEKSGGSTSLSVRTGPSTAPSSADPLAMMEFYMKRAAQEEKRRQPKHSKDEMPPPASLQASGPGKKGHHMGDYIPQGELEKFMASCNDAEAQKAAREAADRARIQADNVGHKLLSKMGWREGEGLGMSRSGISDPIMAGDVKKDNLGVGAQNPGEVNPEDDIYEQYKKRMMLGYRYRPNPLNNPRKAYY